MKYLIATDLDGTLLDNKSNLSLQNKTTLENLDNDKIVRVIATGRSMFSLNRSVKEPLPVDYIVFSTGAGILDVKTGKIIEKTHLRFESVKKVVNLLNELKLDYCIQREIPNNHSFYYKKFSKENRDFSDRVNIYSPYATPLPEELPFEDYTQFVIITEVDKLKYIEIIKKHIPDCKVVRTTSPLNNSSLWIEIFPSSVSKFEGIKSICEIERCEFSLCIGNDYNDIDMLDMCENSFVVSNAPSEFHGRYRVVTDNNSDGFSEAVTLWKKTIGYNI